jgi:hypothetical protein
MSAASRIAFSTLAFPDATTRRTSSSAASGPFPKAMALAQAGRYGGFSGPEGFARASQALKSILNELAISWR